MSSRFLFFFVMRFMALFIRDVRIFEISNPNLFGFDSNFESVSSGFRIESLLYPGVTEIHITCGGIGKGGR